MPGGLAQAYATGGAVKKFAGETPSLVTADKNYRLWRQNPQHPSLRFKSVGEGFWSVRVGKH